jgi:hypothetical protein
MINAVSRMVCGQENWSGSTKFRRRKNGGLRPALGSVREAMLRFAELGPKASDPVPNSIASPMQIAQGPTPEVAAI